MSLIKVKNPGYSLQDFQEEMNRVLEDAFSDMGLIERPKFQTESMLWRPAVELNEQNGNYQLKAELPGINKENIEVEVGENEILLKAKTEKQEEQKGKTYRSEFRYGEYTRRISLPSNVDSSRAKAEYKDGILSITVPKANKEEENIKKIKID